MVVAQDKNRSCERTCVCILEPRIYNDQYKARCSRTGLFFLIIKSTYHGKK